MRPKGLNIEKKKRNIARLCLRRGEKLSCKPQASGLRLSPESSGREGVGWTWGWERERFHVGPVRVGPCPGTQSLYKVSTGNFWSMCCGGYFQFFSWTTVKLCTSNFKHRLWRKGTNEDPPLGKTSENMPQKMSHKNACMLTYMCN